MALLVGTGLALALVTALATAVVRALRFARAIALVELPSGALSPGRTASLRCTVRARASHLPAASVNLALVSGMRRYAVELTLSAGSTERRSMEASNVPRGLYRPVAFALRFTDILALAETRVTGTVPSDESGAVVRVLPDIRATHLMFDSRGMGTERLDTFLSPYRNDDHIETRPYHPGDDMRRINWRMYAHTGDLFVRIGEEVPPPAKAMRLLIDARGLSAPDTIDVLLRCALGVADELARRDYAVEVWLRDIGEASRRLGDPTYAQYVLSGLDPERGLLPMSFGPLPEARVSGATEGDKPFAQPPGRSSEPFSSARELIVAWSRSPASPADLGASAVVAWYRTDQSAKEADVFHLGTLD